MVFISHDLSIVRYLSDRVVVMYLGYVVEQGTTDQIFEPPYHRTRRRCSPPFRLPIRAIPSGAWCWRAISRSATKTRAGLPFQTRCPRKQQVPGTLVRDGAAALARRGRRTPDPLPPLEEILRSMGPVIVQTKEAETA